LKKLFADFFKQPKYLLRLLIVIAAVGLLAILILATLSF
jgi:hypothetical protein